MPRFLLYYLYGGTLLALLAFSQYTGWSFTSTESVQEVPKTVRQNPGSYRSHYFYGGK